MDNLVLVAQPIPIQTMLVVEAVVRYRKGVMVFILVLKVEDLVVMQLQLLSLPVD
jgi:hypothetical protein